MPRGGEHRYKSTTRREGRSLGDDESERTQAENELERLLDEHREGMLVKTGITCRHGQYPRLACSWSGMDAGRRFLQCSVNEDPCDFKYWIDPKFSGRAKRVIQDLVSMNGSMSELVVHFHGQWNQMLEDRQQGRQEIRKLKAVIAEQRSCIAIVLCFAVVMACAICMMW